MVKDTTKNTINTSLSIQYGLIASVLMVILTLMFFWISGAGSNPVIVWNHFILFFVMYAGVRYYKQLIEDGYIKFKQCYFTGLFIGFVAALSFGVFMIIYTKYIDTDLIAFFIKQNETKFSHYIKGDELQKQVNLIIKYSTPFWMGVRAFVEIFLISLFMPLLMGIFFKKDKIEETTNN